MLVVQTCIGSATTVDLVGRQKAKSTKTILNGHTDEAIVVGADDGGEVLSATAGSIATTVDPD